MHSIVHEIPCNHVTTKAQNYNFSYLILFLSFPQIGFTIALYALDYQVFYFYNTLHPT
jgi:hypothetical protein